MDSSRFDDLTRVLANGSSRRRLLRAAIAGISGLTATALLKDDAALAAGGECYSRKDGVCLDGVECGSKARPAQCVTIEQKNKHFRCACQLL